MGSQIWSLSITQYNDSVDINNAEMHDHKHESLALSVSPAATHCRPTFSSHVDLEFGLSTCAGYTYAGAACTAAPATPTRHAHILRLKRLRQGTCTIMLFEAGRPQLLLHTPMPGLHLSM